MFDFNILESVIRLTKKRDKKSLERALINTLSTHVSYEALILLRLPRNDEKKFLEVAASLPESTQDKLAPIPHKYGDPRVHYDESITQCIDNCEVITKNLGGAKHVQRVLFPIVVNHIVIGVLDLYCQTYTENMEKLIRGFIHIYCNFIAIIDDNEHDTLTGLLNRKTFDAKFSELLAIKTEENNTLHFTGEERRTERNDTCHWLGLFDIDHFKRINDNFGHLYGDEVLLFFAGLMRKTFRSSDLLFRYGGEEFVAVLEPTTEADAMIVFERFRKNLALFEFPQVGHITTCVGMVKIDGQCHSTTVLEYADQALYYAKQHGRNQVCNYHRLIQSGDLKERQAKGEVEIFQPVEIPSK